MTSVTKKQVFEIVGVTSAFGVDLCSTSLAWDSVVSVLACNSALTSCSACTSNDDGGLLCGLASKVPSVAYVATNRYFVVVYGYSTAGTDAGPYTLRIT